MPFQKVYFPWRSKSLKLQVGALYLLLVGGVEQDQGGDGGVDLPNVNVGGRVWWNPWTFPWIFFHLYLRYLQYPIKMRGIFEGKTFILVSFKY